jgi:hypothetical protein
MTLPFETVRVSRWGSRVVPVNVLAFTPITPVIVANWSIENVSPVLGPFRIVPLKLPGSIGLRLQSGENDAPPSTFEAL